MVPPKLPFNRSLLLRLGAARELAYPLFRGTFPKSALSGPPSEFDGHRPYLPGDDTRWIDWNIYARSEDLYVKVFQAEEEVEVAIMVDGSLSMQGESGLKGRRAAAAAAALSYLAFLTDHPLSLVRYAERTLDAMGPYRHLHSFPLVTGRLLAPLEGRGTDLGGSLETFLLQRRRPVTVIVITDGFQRKPLESIAGLVRKYGIHRLLLVLIRHPDDHRPDLKGNLLLRDAEGSGRRIVISNRALEKQLHRRIAAYFDNLQSKLKLVDADIFPLPTDLPFEDSFLSVIHSAAARAGRVTV